jgi:predicted HAD superfamily hydrolase
VIKNQVAILDKIGETAWAVVDEDGWLHCNDKVWADNVERRALFTTRARAQVLKRLFKNRKGLRVVKVKLVLA